jgi:hypothetical protein
MGADRGFIQLRKKGVVPIRQRPTTWYHLAFRSITHGLELPLAVDPLEVAHMQPIAIVQGVGAIVDANQKGWGHGLFCTHKYLLTQPPKGAAQMRYLPICLRFLSLKLQAN